MKKLFIISLLLVGCTKNMRTRTFGGSEKVLLKPDEILVNATWKEDDLWVLTYDTVNKAHHFRESSSWGVWEGDVTFAH